MFENIGTINGAVYVEESPAWVHAGLSDKNIAQIIAPLLRFYVVNSPVEGLSARCKTLSEYGWDKPWKKPQKLNQKVKDVSTNSLLYWSGKSMNEMENCLVSAGLFNCASLKSQSYIETAVFYDNKKNQTLSLLYHIRNAFAHGRFAVLRGNKGIWFASEDVQKGANKSPWEKCVRLSARMFLRNSTLTNWMRLIQKGPIDAM